MLYNTLNLTVGRRKLYRSLNEILSRKYHHEGRHKIFGYKKIRQPTFEEPAQHELARIDGNRAVNSNFLRVVNSFREHGHRMAQVDPLGLHKTEEVPELNLNRFQLNLSSQLNPEGLLYGPEVADVQKGIEFLQKTYTSKTGYEFMYIEDEVERDWFAREIESRSAEEISPDQKCRVALEMLRSENFDHYLASKFPTVKRYGGEGCESVQAFYLELLKSCVRHDVSQIVIGMAHRGRLNFMCGLLDYPPVKIFQKIKGFSEFPSNARATGDVISHLASLVDLTVDGKNLHATLLPNPSHLETVNPMVVGKVRARQLSHENYDYSPNSTSEIGPSEILCLQIHGDAALAGQGINQETLGFSKTPHFRIGGSVHVVINNQLGFTTPQELGRSSRYTTDIGKSIGAPVIHVNGDYPEEVMKAARLALDYRQKFHKDIFVDLVCYRYHGHNELDDPTITNPELYKAIYNRKSVPQLYSQKLKDENILSEDQVTKAIEEHNKMLNDNLNQVETKPATKWYLKRQWDGIVEADKVNSVWDTGIDVDLLKYIGAKSVEYPQDFNIHPSLKKMHIPNRIAKITSGSNIDWGTAEALAFGSLLYQDFNVRLSGEDVGRGTFSHRHAMLVDQETGEMLIPLNKLRPEQNSFLEIANSTLSEEAVLSFEYGFSIENPNNLCIWEAQFGDFFNGAQIPIDALIASGETKWMLQSGLVMLLPHGMDGAGPEHSSCRMERFLQLTDSSESYETDGDHNNLQVVNPSTPAQYFHLLRRQMLRNFRKPLVVVAPKILLRLSAATSLLSDMEPNTTFKPVIGDDSVDRNQVKKLVFVSGKHFYTLKQKREELKRNDVALIRIESLCPFPVTQVEEELAKYPNAQKIIWSQEEHRNQGAWTFIKPRFENLIGRQISYVGRGPLAAPAVGVSSLFQKETAQLLNDTFAES